RPFRHPARASRVGTLDRDAERQTQMAISSAQKSRFKQNAIAYSFILPNFLGFAIFTLVPMVFSLVLAFMNWDGAGDITWAGFANFKRMLGDETFRIATVNTFYYSIFTVPLTLIAS